MKFSHFDTEGVYRVYTRGGHKFLIAVGHRGDDHVRGKLVEMDDLRTNVPDHTVDEIVGTKNSVQIRHDDIVAKEYIAPLGRYRSDDE